MVIKTLASWIWRLYSDEKSTVMKICQMGPLLTLLQVDTVSCSVGVASQTTVCFSFPKKSADMTASLNSFEVVF